VIELIGKDREGYEVRKLPYGKVCTWYPDYFVLECECGGLLLCADSTALCNAVTTIPPSPRTCSTARPSRELAVV
jgi:hypothetical protein